jgi:hypothetical protein
VESRPQLRRAGARHGASSVSLSNLQTSSSMGEARIEHAAHERQSYANWDGSI